MNTITVSAPGKLMLFGEHAALYNRPCLVTSVDLRMRVGISLINEPVFIFDAPDVGVLGYKKPMSLLGTGEIPRGVQFVEIAIKNFMTKHPVSGGVSVTTSSDFSSLVGFGTSSASTVCVVKAMAELSGKKIINKHLFDIAYKTVLDIQGKGSGFDVAAAIYGGTLYFVTGGEVIEPLRIKDIPLIVGYTGVKADTVMLMREMGEKMKLQPERVNRIYDAIAKLTEDAKVKMLEGNWERVGKFMDFNQEYLRDLGVSSQRLESLIAAAKAGGAWGAKLSGAGGGDCMIALASEDVRISVEDAIAKAGGQVIHPAVGGAQGARIEA